MLPTGPAGGPIYVPRRYQHFRSIRLPKTPNAGLLNSTWLTLESVFKAHSPYPVTLPRIPMADGARAPPLEIIQNFIKISIEDATLSRESHAGVLKRIPSYPENTFSSRGIIMLAGGRYNMYAATALGVIRETGSRLPIEVWMNDTAEEKKGLCDELAKEGMMCKWLSDYVDWHQRQTGYQLKVMTMMFSSFQQFLFLDADNQPVKNPDAIFDSQSFIDNGAILWLDYWDHTRAPLLPYIVGLIDGASELFRKDKTVESGQVVWDKKRHWMVYKPQALLPASILTLVPRSLFALLLITTFMDLSITIPWPHKASQAGGIKILFR